MSDHQITAHDIEKAKKACDPTNEGHYEHDDCVRIAFEWLDAQNRIKGAQTRIIDIKHIIRKWGGRFVSTHDIDAAAFLHPWIKGRYPFYNISSRLVEPGIERLSQIPEAFTHHYTASHDPKVYKIKEPTSLQRPVWSKGNI